MSSLRLVAAAVCAAALVSAPAMARQTHTRSHHHLATAAAAVPGPGAIYVGGRLCIPAPRVGAFATEPWTNDVPCEPNTGYNNGY